MQLTQSQVQDDVRFWLNQDREHALFYLLGLRDPQLQAQAARIHGAYEEALGRDDLRRGLQILQQSQALKQVLMRESRRRFIGWLFPDFYDHTWRELDVMLRRIRPGGISARDELCEGNLMNAEHAAFAAHLLDPVERPLVDAANNASKQAGQIAAGCMSTVYPTLVTLSRQAGTAIDRFAKDALPGAQSIVHPVLLAHVQREGERFLSTLDRLPMQDAA